MGFLQVLLLILKIIGILLASVIGLLLLSVAVLLFVPVRYRLMGHKAEDYGIEAKITWLMRLFRVRINYTSDTKFSYEVYLLWFLFLSSDEAWKAARKEKKKKKAEKKAQKQKEKRAKAKARRKKKQNSATVQKRIVTTEKTDTATKQVALPEQEAFEETRQQDVTEDKTKNWFIRFRDKVIEIVQKIKQKLAAVFDMLKALWQKADKVVGFLKEETNKVAFGASWTTLVQILKHMGPTKVQGYLAFGMDDPAATGYILAVLGIFYGRFGKSFSIRPNFEEKQFETEIRAKGRIRASRLLHLAWKLWKNKDFKSLLDNIKQLKADIKTNGG